MNNFSKLIAFTSMLSENESKIKLTVIEEYQGNKAEELEKIHFVAFETFSRNIDCFMHELVMANVIEISPQDFIEFIKEKNLCENVISIYETQMRLSSKEKIASVKKAFEKKTQDLFRTEKKICMETNQVMNMQATLREKLNSHRTLRNRTPLRRTCTMKEGRAQEKELSAEKWKQNQITPMYFNILQNMRPQSSTKTRSKV